MSHTAASHILRKIELFQHCSEKELTEIGQLLTYKEVKKREILFHETDLCDVIYFIAEGRIKVYKTTKEGREQIVNLLSDGDMFPLVGLYGGGVYPATAEVVEPGQIYYMNVNHFVKFLEENPTLSVKLLKELERKIKELQRRLTDVLSKDITEKIYNMLFSLAKTKGTKTEKGYEVEIELTHQEIADMVGTTRETASRTLGHLKKDGKIKMNQHRIIVLFRKEPLS